MRANVVTVLTPRAARAEDIDTQAAARTLQNPPDGEARAKNQERARVQLRVAHRAGRDTQTPHPFFRLGSSLLTMSPSFRLFPRRSRSVAIHELTDEQIRTWTLEEKDRWWLDERLPRRHAAAHAPLGPHRHAARAASCR